MHEPEITTKPPALSNKRQKVILNFGLFAVFFIFYVVAAAVQTPEFKAIASVPTFGMPLGLLLSLAVFPLSWILMIIWFRKAR